MKINKKKTIIAVSALVLIVALVAVAGIKAVKTYRNLTGLLEESSQKMTVATNAIEKSVPLYTMPKYNFDYSWLENNPPLCLHAMGGIDDKTYTNSHEAFMENYGRGGAIFEVDFQITADNRLVAAHDEQLWREIVGNDSAEFNIENFKSELIYDKYTPLSSEDVLHLLAEYPNVYIITDTKQMGNADVYFQFSTLVKEAQGIDPSVLDRIIPQIYEEEMLYRIMDVYEWKSVVFTLYQTDYTTQSLQAFVLNSGVRCITMWDSVATQEMIGALDSVGAKVAVHTVNDEAYAKLLISSGVDLIYTDFLEPKNFA